MHSHVTCGETYLPWRAAVDSDHWLEAEMSSSRICPPDIPRGYRHTSETQKPVLMFHYRTGEVFTFRKLWTSITLTLIKRPSAQQKCVTSLGKTKITDT